MIFSPGFGKKTISAKSIVLIFPVFGSIPKTDWYKHREMVLVVFVFPLVIFFLICLLTPSVNFAHTVKLVKFPYLHIAEL